MSFNVEAKTVTTEQVIACANELEDVIGEIMNGKKKPKDLPIEPMVRLIQFARNMTATDMEHGQLTIVCKNMADYLHLKDWHKLNEFERQMVIKLENLGFLEKKKLRMVLLVEASNYHNSAVTTLHTVSKLTQPSGWLSRLKWELGTFCDRLE